jgi:hypothetical protein
MNANTNIDLNDPITVLIAAAEAFEKAAIPMAVYGGLALAAYGQARETRDADLAVAGTNAATGLAALKSAGLDALLTFDRVRFGGQHRHVSRLTLLGGKDRSLNTVDLVEPLSSRYAALVLTRAITGTLRDRTVRVVSPEDFVVMKILSTRERDIEDAATVVRALGSDLDVAAIEREVVLLTSEIHDHPAEDRWQRAKAAVG